MTAQTQRVQSVWQRYHLGYWLLLTFAACIYISGLGGHFIPRNGDEMVYAHIARLTAQSNQWLPLVSELNNMRNTKPPLLFWQALVAGDWGTHWTLAALRLPSLAYTFLVTAGIVVLTRQLSRSMKLALLAGAIYLAFFCTFRYGRPYLTSAAESFWFNLPIFVLLLRYLRPSPSSAVYSWAWALPFGLALACGLLYKSFALIAPAGACLAFVAWRLQTPQHWSGYVELAFKVGASCALALGIFALWFALDPDPQAVWKEFIVGENVGKMNHNQGYLRTALWGGSSMWVQLLGYAQNAGLLAMLVIGAMGAGAYGLWRKLRGKPQVPLMPNGFSIDKLALGAVLGVLAIWLIIFTLPSQRSARYLIPAMPFLAIVLALLWHRLHAWWFKLSLVLIVLVLCLFGTIGWSAYQLHIASPWQWGLLLTSLVVGAASVVAGFAAPYLRNATVLAALAVLATFNAMVAPLDSSAAALTQTHSAQWRGKHIAVPDGFNGQFERYQFILPGNRYSTYDADAALGTVLAQFDAVMWVGAQPPPCAAQNTCTVIASRWDVRTRHASGEITLNNILRPQEWLFRREWMLSRAV
jgi:4-amino-4-deoxy-L-arabinose transferase-like glycosyltransferase